MANVKYLDSIGTQALITEIKTRLAAKAAQYSTMPTAAVGLVGQVVQFIGATGAFTQGDFYICAAVADSDPTEYEWVKLTYNKDEVDELIGAAGHFEVVDALPTSDIKTNVIYLVPKTEVLDGYSNGDAFFYVFGEEDGSEVIYVYKKTDGSDVYAYNMTMTDEASINGMKQSIEHGGHTAATATAIVRAEQNVKDEFINLDGTSSGWEKIGDTELDLSDYVQFEDLTAITSAELTDMWGD